MVRRLPWFLAAALLGLVCVPTVMVRADDEPRSDEPRSEEPAPSELVAVPHLPHRTLKVARALLEGAGLEVGTVYEMSWRRVMDRWGFNVKIGSIVLQRPSPTSQTGERVPRGTKVQVIVSAVADGKLPPSLPPPNPNARGEIGTEQRRKNDGKGAETVTPRTPEKPADEPAPDAPAPEGLPPAPTPEPTLAPDPVGEASKPQPDPQPQPQPQPPDPAPAPDPAPEEDEGARDDGPAVATGSPEAPKPAPAGDPRLVPHLLGLELTHAEQLIRDSDMKLYVERVPGHPVGRILEQTPEPWEPRPSGGVVKVLLTAGGDFKGATPPAPEVYVDERVVPMLLDHPEARALRILRDLDLQAEVVTAKRGLPGKVVNQKPFPGERVPGGSLVRVFVGPPDPEAKPPAPPPDIPVPRRPDRAPPGPSAAANALVPIPVSPAAGTAVPGDASVPLGFTWRRVDGAGTYLLEVEEETEPGTWVGILSKPVRTSAAMVEVERLDPNAPGRLRWRVRAVVSGKPGTWCDWVVLK